MKSRSTASTNLTKVKQAILFRRFLCASVVGMAVFVMAFVMVPYLIAEVNATTASTDVSWENISLTLDPDYAATQGGGSVDDPGHGDIEFGDVIPTARDTTTVGSENYGTQKVAKKTIRVVTSGKHYAVYLSTNDSSSSALKISANDSDQTIDVISSGATVATFGVAQSFTGTGWGYAVPNTPVSGADARFATENYAAYNNNLAGTTNDNLTRTGTGSAFYNSGVWAAVPTKNSAQQIWKAENASGFNGGSTFDVYYSIMVDTDVVSGTYENEVVYTAMASSADLDTVSTNMSRSKEFVTSGTVETLKVDLVSNSASITTNDVKVYLVPHSTFVTNSYSVSGLVAENYNQCTVTAVTSDERAATITCTMPNIGATATGANPDTIVIAGDNSALANTSSSVTGEYDFWVHVTKYGTENFDYVSHYTNGGVVASVVYAGLQSKETSTRGGNGYITTMQEMEPTICKNTNTWGKTIGADARVYSATETTVIASSSITDAKAIVNSGTTLETGYTIASQSAKVGIGTFLLADSRDNKTYLVRRLADGQCWMVQNLDLNLADFAGTHNLTSENTNITSDYWDPSAKMLAKSSVLETTGSTANLAVSTYQFQAHNNFGNDLKWGSVCTENTGQLAQVTDPAECSPIAVANNKNAAYARSYNNDSATATSTGTGNGPAYITGTSNVVNATTCAAYTSTEQSGHTECTMGGRIGDASLSAGTYTGSNNLARDTAWQPGLITDHGTGSTENYVNGSDTFTMRGSMYSGDYYNWYAATAEAGDFSTATTVSQDICPKGWRLPVNDGSTDGSWTKLLRTTYGLTGSGYGNGASIAKVMQLPLSIPATGYYGWANGTLYGRGYGGYYWSSTAYSTTDAYYLYFYYGGYFNPQNGNYKVYGFTVRCVAQ